MKIGIDFGTSFSLPATVYLNQNLVLLPSGKYGIPSIFYYDGWSGILIGEEAESAGQGESAKNMKREIKLELNSNFIADGKKFSAEEIVGHILNYVKQYAIDTAQQKMINSKLEGVVISVPAAFTHNEKEIIKNSVEKSMVNGFTPIKVLGFIKEPVAAALSYFKTTLADKTKVLVYDLGGGTCDVAIVEANSSAKEKYTVLDSDMIRVGGKDWDSKLQEYILRKLEVLCGNCDLSKNPGYMEKIKRAAISVKHAFSEKIMGRYRDRTTANVEIDGRLYRIPLDNNIFNELTNELFNKTLKLTKEIIAKNNCQNIKKIICVGGSSNMPQVQEGLKRAFPRMEIQVFEPEKAIAIGAAIYAESCDIKSIDNTLVSDITPFSYGIKCYENYAKDPNKMIILNLLKKGDRLPVSNNHSFVTIMDNQVASSFEVYENINKVDKYDYNPFENHIMEVVLELPPNKKKGYKTHVCLELSTNGMLNIKAYDNAGNIITASKKINF